MDRFSVVTLEFHSRPFEILTGRGTECSISSPDDPDSLLSLIKRAPGAPVAPATIGLSAGAIGQVQMTLRIFCFLIRGIPKASRAIVDTLKKDHEALLYSVLEFAVSYENSCAFDICRTFFYPGIYLATE